MARQWVKARTTRSTGSRVYLYTLDVFIISGPMTDSFVKNNRVISRTIQIRGDQTLEDLHYAIFDAFDREDQHMFEFQIGGKGPMDPRPGVMCCTRIGTIAPTAASRPATFTTRRSSRWA